MPQTTLGLTINKLMHLTNGNPNAKNGLRIASWNCDRAFISKEKIRELEDFMNSQKLDICGVFEVSVTKTRFLDDHLHKVKGYRLIFPASWTKHGHSRMVLYVRECLVDKMHIWKTKMTQNQPDIWLSIKLKTPNMTKKQNVTLGFYYREWKNPFTLGNSIESQTQRLKVFLDSAKYFIDKGETWIFSDANVDYNKITKNENLNDVDKMWHDFIRNEGLDQLVNIQTRSRVVAGSVQQSLLDHIVTNRKELATKVKVTKTSKSDHAIISMTRITNSRFAPAKITVRSYKKLNIDQLNNDLAAQDWSAMNGANIDEMENSLTTALQNVLNKHAPKITFTPTNKYHGLSKEIQDMIQMRELARKRYMLTGLVEDKSNWKKLKNKITGMIKKERNKNEELGFLDPVKAWRVFKEMENKAEDDGPPKMLLLNGELENDKFKIAEALNNHFVTKTEKNIAEIEKVKLMSSEPVDCPSILFKQTSTSHCEPWSLQETTEEEVAKIIDNLNNSTGTGVDQISNKFIKLTKKEIAKPLTILINTSIRSGQFPSRWKLGLVTPLFKKNNRLEVENFRPITILSKVSLILEKIVNNQFKEICHRFKLIDQNQHSYAIGKGCDTALIAMFNRWQLAANKGDFTGIIMTDMRDAFGLVTTSVFDKKISCTKASLTTRKWFKSYMTRRNQMTKIEDKVSRIRQLPSGLPQGSVLACLGFLFFTSDLPKCLVHATMDNFADDSTSSISGKDPADLVMKLESDAKRISNYMISNALLLAPEKTVLMIAAGQKKMRSEETKNLTVTVGGHVIKQSRSAKLLGITINQDLTHSDFLYGTPENKKEKGLIRQLSDRLNLISRLKNCPLKTKRMFISSLFGGKLNYCMAVWGGLTQSQLKPLQALQHRAARLATNLNRFTPKDALLKKCNWLSIENLVKKHTLRIMFAIRTNENIPYLNNFLGKRRRSLGSTIPVYDGDQTESYKRSFVPRAIKNWNSLPDEIRHTQPKFFKKRLHKHLLEIQTHQQS